MNTIFFKPKNASLAKAISIKSVAAYRDSIQRVKNLKGIAPLTKTRALALAKARATAQLNRSNLSQKERKQFSQIRKIKIPAMKN